MISEVIKRDVSNPHVSELVKSHGCKSQKICTMPKYYISVIGTEQKKVETIEALTSAAGFIAVNSSKKVVMRYFPELTFKLDDSVDKHMRIEELLNDS